MFSDAAKAIGTNAKLVILMLVPMATFFLTTYLSDLNIDPDLSIVWFLTSLTIIGSAAGMYYVVVNELKLGVAAIQETSSTIREEIKDVLNEELQYTTIPLSTKKDLRIEATKLYRSVIKSEA